METSAEKESMVNFSMWVTPRQLRKILDVIDTPSHQENQEGHEDQEVQEVQEVQAAHSTDVDPRQDTAQGELEMGYSSTGQLIPWDERIHTSNRSKTSGNRWRIKSKIDRAKFLPSIEAEIWAGMIDIDDEHQDGMDSHTETAAHSAAKTEESIDNEPYDTNQIDIEDDIPLFNISFSELVPYVSKAKRQQLITSEEIEDSCRNLDIKNFGVLATSPSLIPEMIKNLNLSTFILQEQANEL